MLGLVKYALGPEGVELRELPDPVPGPGELKVNVLAAGICGSEAVKILLPSQRCSIRLAVGESQPLQFYLDQAVRLLGEELQKRGAG